MILKAWLPVITTTMANLVRQIIAMPSEWTVTQVSAVMPFVIWQCGYMLLPLFGAALAVGLLVNYAQVGVLFTTETLKPKLENISLAKGLKRMFGMKALVNLGKAVLKVLIIGYFLFDVIRSNFYLLPALQNMPILNAAATLGAIMFEMAWKVALAFLLVAFIDFLYQWWEYEKNLRMSLQELKDEFKQTEGDPYLKAEIKKKQRTLAMRRMMEDLKTADVVVTNPTHYAVALKYDPKAFSAPQVVAKGQNFVAKRIREVARENGITIVENKELARALYAQVDLGELVPSELYAAVAEVLAFVYKINKRRRGYRPVYS